ncbi:MAG: ABC transporter permease, partial [Opitutaceae bacterium]|nr:ABC transporter permease [Opitutaceae bacterium]
MSSIRIALRSLLKSPGFVSVAVLTIALGIGANTVLFSVFNTVVLSPLEFTRSDRLVRLWIDDPTGNFNAPAASWPKYQHYREHAKSFQQLSASTGHNATLTGEGDAEQLNGLTVTENFLPTLGLQVQHGRDFGNEDAVTGGLNTTIVTHELWQNRFSGRDSLIGDIIELNGVATTVIGVLPPDLPFPFNQVQYLVPRPHEQAGIPLEQVEQGGAVYLQLTGRLTDNATLAAADSEIRTLSASYNTDHPERMDAKSDHRVLTFAEELVGNVRPTFYVLIVACSFLLLIACANIASLFLGRLTARQKEIAVRLSLGATRKDIVRQFLTESLIFSLGAAALGLIFSLWGISAVATFAANQLPRAENIAFDGSVIWFSLASALVPALLVGLFPAWQASRANINQVLNDTTRSGGGGTTGKRWRAGLIVAEVTLSVMLLVGAGLLLTSFWKLINAETGFDAEGVAVSFVSLPTNRYDTPEKRIAFHETVSAELSRQPHITAAAPVIGMPLTGFSPISPYTVGGQEILPLPQRPLAGFRVVGLEYKDVIKLTLQQGRWFDATDTLDTQRVCMINDSLAAKIFPNESAIGRTILTGAEGEQENVIIGIIRDVKTTGLNLPAPDEIYYPATQRAYGGMAIAARTTGDAILLQSAMRNAVSQTDPSIALSSFQTMEAITRNSLGVQRIAAWLIGCFSGISFLLAIVGLYSVLAYNVTQRTDR